MKRLILKLIEQRFYTYLAILAIAVFGTVAYYEIGVDFFPDAERPGVVVLVEAPGMSAEDIEQDISRPIERTCYSIDSVRKVSSINRDSMAVINVEFNYKKPLDAALLEVSNAIKTVRLPEIAKTPVLFKTGDFTRPIMTLAVSSKDGLLPISMVRQVADNELKDRLLTIEDVASVEVFGGEKRQLQVSIDIKKMLQYGLMPSDIISALKENNISLPAGILINNKNSILLKLDAEARLVSELGEIMLKGRNGVVALKDIASINMTTADRYSSFFYNGKQTVAINLLRSQYANTLETILKVKRVLPDIQKEFPGLDIRIADSQERVIELSVTNLKSSLFIAVILTVVVLFFFIGQLRVSFLVALSLPLTYLLTFIVMWAMDMRFNIITMSAIIISSGMLVDNNIVVAENIQRHLNMKSTSMLRAIADATSEVAISIFSGTLSTILVLIPVMFLGGYVQKILKPLAVTLVITLIASYIVALWFVPVLYPWVYRVVSKLGFIETLADRIAELSQRYIVDSIRDFFAGFFKLVNRYRILVIPLILLFPLSMALMDSLVGRDLMPPMDTGIVMIDLKLSPEYSVQKTEEILRKIDREVFSRYNDITISKLAYIGSEPGLISFGSGRTQSDIAITLNFVDRFHRNKTVWEIEEEIRNYLERVKGVFVVNVREYGATPLSSIAAPIDVQVAGSDIKQLDKIAAEIERKLIQRPGFTSISRNWYLNKKQYMIRFDKKKAAYYGVSPLDVSYYLAQMLGGVPGGVLRVEGQDGIEIRTVAEQDVRGSIERIETLPIPTKKGYIPLNEIAQIRPSFVSQLYTRDDLSCTVHVYGYKATAPTTFLDKQRDIVLKGIDIPSGISISKEGEIKQMTESFGRLGKALIYSLILLLLAFVVIFRSFSDSLIIMLAIPLSFIGAVWGLLIAGKHGCMPAFMGFILLIGVIVNNSILLVDFVKRYRHRFKDPYHAVYEAVRVRTRPVVATAVTTIAGMIPIATERAFGLERLSPLAIVAIGGLFIGTFLTLVYTPVFYLIKERLFEVISIKKTATLSNQKDI